MSDLLLGDELDGRGRIYLIKNMLEGKVPAETVTHIDRCLRLVA